MSSENVQWEFEQKKDAYLLNRLLLCLVVDPLLIFLQNGCIKWLPYFLVRGDEAG